MERYVYWGVFLCLSFFVYLISAIVFRKVTLEDMLSSVKLDINLQQMIESEQRITDFLKKNDLNYGSSIWDIAKILKVEQGKEDSTLKEQANISEPDQNGISTVNFQESLSFEEKKFYFAHECAHIINGDPLPNKRPEGRNKSIEDQLADYTAAAILMPRAEIRFYLKENNYESVSTRRRVGIIKQMCRKYEVTPILALRRIKEIQELEKASCN